MGRLLENRLAAGLLALGLGLGSAAVTGAALPRGAEPGAVPAATCRLANGIEHVIYLQFDNVHLSRDVPGVPSDLEQMPHLLEFLEANGTLLTNHHTPLISHTGGDLLTSLTGLYPDRHGQAVSNSWHYFNPDGSTGVGNTFGYWTSKVYDLHTSTPTDTSYNLLTPDGRNVPAPWTAFTRAGCDVGSVAGPGGLVLEHIPADVEAVFGAGSPEAELARTDGRRAWAELFGVAVHCAQRSRACAPARGGRPDRLPDEPGGYEGFNALYGHRYVAPAIAGWAGRLAGLDGKVIQGFPGFDAMTPAVSLGYVAAMQEHGVAVTYAHLSSAHDPRDGGGAFGPGEAGYVQQLKEYDAAFASFFERLQRAGITATNSLFVVSADEGDHFVGGPPSPPGCDGVHTACRYGRIGQVQVNLTGLLAEQRGITGAFAVHDDSAPAVWVSGNPDPEAPAVRALERAAGRLLVRNPYLGSGQQLAAYLADRTEMGLLHMLSGDPARTPTFVLFARPDYFVFGGPVPCAVAGCVSLDPRRAYSHGGVDADVTTTWLGLVAPGVARRGIDGRTWADEADIRPTTMALTGLRDRYDHDGRVLSELFEAAALPAGIRGSRAAYEMLAAAFKQLNAPVGRLGLLSLAAATQAIVSESAGDSEYRAYLARMRGLAARREAASGRMLGALAAAGFAGRAVDPRGAAELLAEADTLMAEFR